MPCCWTYVSNNMLGLVPKIHTIGLVHYTVLLDLCNKMLTIVASLSP